MNFFGLTILTILVLSCECYVSFSEYDLTCGEVFLQRTQPEFGVISFMASSAIVQGNITYAANLVYDTDQNGKIACEKAISGELREFPSVKAYLMRYGIMVDEYDHRIEFNPAKNCYQNNSNFLCVNLESDASSSCNKYGAKQVGNFEMWSSPDQAATAALSYFEAKTAREEISRGLDSTDGSYCHFSKVLNETAMQDNQVAALQDILRATWAEWEMTANGTKKLAFALSNMTSDVAIGGEHSMFRDCHELLSGYMTSLGNKLDSAVADADAEVLASIFEEYESTFKAQFEQCVSATTENVTKRIEEFDFSAAGITEEHVKDLLLAHVYHSIVIAEAAAAPEIVYSSHMAHLQYEMMASLNNLSYSQEQLDAITLEILDAAILVNDTDGYSLPFENVTNALNMSLFSGSHPWNATALLSCMVNTEDCRAKAVLGLTGFESCGDIFYCMEIYKGAVQERKRYGLTGNDSIATGDPVDELPAQPGPFQNTTDGSKITFAPDIAYAVVGESQIYARVYPTYSNRPGENFVDYHALKYYSEGGEGSDALLAHCMATTNETCASEHFPLRYDEHTGVRLCCAYPPGTYGLFGATFFCNDDEHLYWESWESCSGPHACTAGYYDVFGTCTAVEPGYYSPYENNTKLECTTNTHVAPYYDETALLPKSFSQECNTELVMQAALAHPTSLLTEKVQIISMRFSPNTMEFGFEYYGYYPSVASEEYPHYQVGMFGRPGQWIVYLDIEYAEDGEAKVSPCIFDSASSMSFCGTGLTVLREQFFTNDWETPSFNSITELKAEITTLNATNAALYNESDIIVSWSIGSHDLGNSFLPAFSDSPLNSSIFIGGFRGFATPVYVDIENFDGFIYDFTLDEKEVNTTTSAVDGESDPYTELLPSIGSNVTVDVPRSDCPVGYFAIWKLENESDWLKIVLHSENGSDFRLKNITIYTPTQERIAPIECKTSDETETNDRCDILTDPSSAQEEEYFSIVSNFGRSELFLRFDVAAHGGILKAKDILLDFGVDSGNSHQPSYIEVYRVEASGAETLLLPMTSATVVSENDEVYAVFSDRSHPMIDIAAISCASCNYFNLDEFLLSSSSVYPHSSFDSCSCLHKDAQLKEGYPNSFCPAPLPTPKFDMELDIGIIQGRGNVSVSFDCGLAAACEIKYTTDGAEPELSGNSSASGRIPVVYPQNFGITELKATVFGELNGYVLNSPAVSQYVDVLGEWDGELSSLPLNNTKITVNASLKATSENSDNIIEKSWGMYNFSVFGYDPNAQLLFAFSTSPEPVDTTELQWHEYHNVLGLNCDALYHSTSNNGSFDLKLFFKQKNNHFLPSSRVDIFSFELEMTSADTPATSSSGSLSGSEDSTISIFRSFNLFQAIGARYTIPISLMMINIVIFFALIAVLVFVVLLRTRRNTKTSRMVDLNTSLSSIISTTNVGTPSSSSGSLSNLDGNEEEDSLNLEEEGWELNSSGSEEMLAIQSTPPRPVAVRVPGKRVLMDLMI